MSDIQLGPETYVRAAHFMHNDDAALFGALAAIDRSVGLVIIEDPQNPLLRRHAEIRARELANSLGGMDDRFATSPLGAAARELFGGEEAVQLQIEHELRNLQSIMETPDMGVFAIYGDEADVVRFIRAHLDQPAA